jgi:hypothetical protein
VGYGSLARPTQQLVLQDAEPDSLPNPLIQEIGGVEIPDPAAEARLPAGYGYDSAFPSSADPDQRKDEHEPVLPMPYLGALTLYQDFAVRHKGNTGSRLTYRLYSYDPSAERYNDGPQGSYEDTGQEKTLILDTDSTNDPLNHQYPYPYYDPATGPDLIQGQGGDDGKPLILMGTDTHPIEIDGTIVVKGDVIIRGVVKGRGTIYAGRNIHVVGDIEYANRPLWPALGRNPTTGQIRAFIGEGHTRDVGYVCDDGTYHDASVTDPC